MLPSTFRRRGGPPMARLRFRGPCGRFIPLSFPPSFSCVMQPPTVSFPTPPCGPVLAAEPAESRCPRRRRPQQAYPASMQCNAEQQRRPRAEHATAGQVPEAGEIRKQRPREALMKFETTLGRKCSKDGIVRCRKVKDRLSGPACRQLCGKTSRQGGRPAHEVAGSAPPFQARASG